MSERRSRSAGPTPPAKGSGNGSVLLVKPSDFDSVQSLSDDSQGEATHDGDALRGGALPSPVMPASSVLRRKGEPRAPTVDQRQQHRMQHVVSDLLLFHS